MVICINKHNHYAYPDEFTLTSGYSVTGYVIMPNHLHLLLHYVLNGQSLNKAVSNGKRFVAYNIIRRLGNQQQNQLLVNLAFDVCTSDRKRGKKREVWIGKRLTSSAGKRC